MWMKSADVYSCLNKPHVLSLHHLSLTNISKMILIITGNNKDIKSNELHIQLSLSFVRHELGFIKLTLTTLRFDV